MTLYKKILTSTCVCNTCSGHIHLHVIRVYLCVCVCVCVGGRGVKAFNSLHATDLYIDFMNNSLAKKEIMKRKKKERKKVTEPGYELKTNL